MPERSVAQSADESQVFLPPGGEYALMWERIEGFIQRGSWEAAVDGLVRYAELAEKPEENGVVSSGARIAVGIRRLLARTVASLPNQFREAYQKRLDVAITDIWSEAKDNFAPDELRQLRGRLLRDYPGTSLYLPLLRQEIDERFEIGHWEKARAASEMFLASSPPPSADASALLDQVRARLILTQIYTTHAQPKKLTQQLTALEKLQAELGFSSLGGPWQQRVSQTLKAAPLLLNQARPSTKTQTRRTHPSSMVESVSLDATSSPFQLGQVIWRESISSARLRPMIAELTLDALDGGMPLPYFPAVADGTIFFQHVDRVIGLEVSPPQVRWHTPLPPDPLAIAALRTPIIGTDSCFVVSHSSLLALDRQDGSPRWKTRFTYDRAQKTLRIEAVDATGSEPPPARRFQVYEEEAREEEETDEEEGREDNEEKTPADGDSDDGESSGPTAEESDGDQEDDAEGQEVESSTPVSLVGTPTPFHNRLIVPVTVRLDEDFLIYLVAIDLQGEAIWSTYLGSTGNSNYLGLGSPCAPPLVYGNQLFLLTNQGFLAAVDAEDGTIDWLLEYPTLSPRAHQEALRTTNRWQINPLVRVGDTLLMGPQDSSQLLAVNLRTGHLGWRVRREHNAVFLGATEQACILSGRTIAAIAHTEPRQGEELWRVDPAAFGFEPFGRPLLTPQTVLIPGRRHLITLATRDGKLISRTHWDYGGGGNVLQTGTMLAVVTPESLLLYNDRSVGSNEPLDDDTAVLLLQAKHALRNYELEDGLNALRRWSASAPRTPVPNLKLDQIHLELAELTAFLAQVETGARRLGLLRYRYLLERLPERKVRAAVALAEYQEETNDFGGALASYHGALKVDQSRTEFSVREIAPLSADAYLRDRIRTLRQKVQADSTLDRRVFAAIESEATARLQEAGQRGTPLAYEGLIARYPFTLAAAKAHLRLADLYTDRLSYGPATIVLENYLRDYTNHPTIPEKELARVELILTRLLFESDRFLEAKSRSAALIEKYGSLAVERVPNMSEGETIEEHLKERLQDPQVLAVPAGKERQLRTPIRMLWRSPADLAAVGRRFLRPEGTPPKVLAGHFLTQSNKVIECRSVETGTPRWRIQLDFIPGFEISMSNVFRARRGLRPLKGRYEGERLVLYDEWNLFAIDASTGSVRWHVPFRLNSSGDQEDRAAALRRTRERIRRVLVSPTGIHALTSRNTLYHFNLQGERLWSTQLEYEPASLLTPVLTQNKLFVFSRRPTGIQVHDALTGEKLRYIGDENEAQSRIQVLKEPLRLSEDRVVLRYDNRLELFDLAAEEVVWTYQPGPTRVKFASVNYFEGFPGEVIAVFNRPGNHPVLAAVSLQTGTERWRYEKFPSARARFSVFRQGNRFYVVHGRDNWDLQAIELRTGAAVDRPVVGPVWPESTKLGVFYSGVGQRRVFLGADIILFHTPTDILAAYDKDNGTARRDVAETINRFLREKGNFASDMVNGRFVVLTDGGDCAFESLPRQAPEDDLLTNVEIVRQWFAKPQDDSLLTRIAQEYFKRGRLAAAIDLLDQALLSEDGMSQGAQLRVRYMLDGLKQEFMERQFKEHGGEAPLISTQRLRHAPSIDGQLDDFYDVGSRIRMQAPRYVGTIPGPDRLEHWSGEEDLSAIRLRHWDGEEDLSAILYTAWDAEYFYFLLDVTDDDLKPYDRDAENWKGDCLIIALDPTDDRGFRQRGNDQLMTLALTVPKRRLDDKEEEEEEEEESGETEEEEEEEEEERKKPEGLFSVKRKADNSGAIYEVGLPWTSFGSAFADGQTPARGYTFGLSLLLTDDDTGRGATKTLSINPCQILPYQQKSPLVWRFVVPNFFPRVRLE